MKNQKLKKTILLAVVILTIAGCGNRPEPTPTIDPVMVMTDVAGTVQAEVTANAMLTPSATMPPPATPTFPPVPTQALPAVPTSSTGLAVPTVPAGQLQDVG